MVGRKEKIELFVLLAFLLLSPSIAYAQTLEEAKEKIAERAREYDKKVNFGITAGFRSSNYVLSKLNIDGDVVEDKQNNFKMSYGASFYARFNFKRKFLQTEVSYNINSSEVVLDKANTSASSTDRSMTSTVHSLGFPILFGYYIVRNGPYDLSVFGGPKLEYLYKYDIKYKNFDQQNIDEQLYPINIAGVLGMSISISRIFFEFRYEQQFLNVSKSITYTPPATANTTETGSIRFHRRASGLCFSVGLIF